MRTILIAAIAALAFASAADAQGGGGTGKHPVLTVHGVSADRASPCLSCSSKTPKGQVRRQRPHGR